MKSKLVKHIALRVAYDGSAFEGFQYQKSGKSIQQALEKALAKLYKFKGRIHFSSRTDTGVSALDQFVVLPNFYEVFDGLNQGQKDRFIPALNYYLGSSIRVWRAVGLRSEFNIKRDVLWKEYRYRILNSFFEDPLEYANCLWIRKPLNFSAMQKEAGFLLGRHDFAGFAKSSARDLRSHSEGSFREVLKAGFKRSKHSTFDDACYFEFRIRAKGFLHHMVRNIVGTLVEAGCGKDVSVVKVLKSKNRQLAGPNVPASPLCLVKTKIAAGYQVSLGLPND